MPASVREDNRHIGWLMSRVGSNQGRIADMLRHLAGLGPVDKLKPALFAKFLRIVAEIALARDEENGIISRIEHIEQKHRHLRRSKMLKKFMPLAKSANSNTSSKSEYADGPNQGHDFLKLALVWWLFAGGKRNQKKQGLAAD